MCENANLDCKHEGKCVQGLDGKPKCDCVEPWVGNKCEDKKGKNPTLMMSYNKYISINTPK